jgi:peptide/nickel transport system substrate-binding protein
MRQTKSEEQPAATLCRPVLLLSAALLTTLPAFASPKVIETPALEKQVAAGTLPPIAQRLPANPLVTDLKKMGRKFGRHGGTLRLLMGRSKDIRMITVYGYARLVGYDAALKIVPDILERVETNDNRRFTLYLRKGHKWSDGHPFTTEDFRYYWDDVANNRKLSPFGPPKALLVDDEAPRFEILGKHVVRFSWTNENPYFLARLAGSRPLYIYRPAHYLKRFHARYADATKLAQIAKARRARNWAVLDTRMDHQYRFDNPDLPTLQPWLNTTRPPSQRFVFKRNPYYHRIDAKGRQFPYIDGLVVSIASNKLIPTKTGAGDSDLQARGLRFDNFTFLKKGEARHGYKVHLWRTARGARVALYPNLNTEDPVWREMMRDARFRRALSLSIKRADINQSVFFGLARETANTVLKESPLYRDEYAKKWAKYDPTTANRLLDEIGLSKRDARGIRLLRDGRPVEIIVDTAGESTMETDVLELVRENWMKIGIKLHTRPSQREVFRNRIFAGLALMSVWTGLENAVATADMSPAELAPTSQQQLHWPKWGQHFETSKKAGIEPDTPAARELLTLNAAWRRSKSSAERARIWHRMLGINADQVFTIGVVSGVLQPVVINGALRNVPSKGIYNWEPGAYFGLYRPETFWFSKKRRRKSR